MSHSNSQIIGTIELHALWSRDKAVVAYTLDPEGVCDASTKATPFNERISLRKLGWSLNWASLLLGRHTIGCVETAKPTVLARTVSSL